MMKDKLNVIDLFSGAGGLSKGFLDAGMNVVIGVDNDKYALETFEHNHDGWIGLSLEACYRRCEKQWGSLPILLGKD